MFSGMPNTEQFEMMKMMEGGGAPASPKIPHTEIYLRFPESLVQAMKKEAMKGCGPGEYVSSNDMITAVGWVIMAELSGNHDWGMNVLVNVRGRSPGLEILHRDQDPTTAVEGVFGNGIMGQAVECSVPLTPTVECVCTAAMNIRQAILKAAEDIPRKLRAAQVLGFG